MIRALFLFLAFAFSSSAFSAGIVAVGPNSYRVVPTGKSDRGMTWAAPQFGAVATTAAVASSSRSLTIVGEAVEVVGRQTLSRGAMIAGVAAVFAGPVGGPVLAIGSAVLQQLSEYGQVNCPGGVCTYDPGRAEGSKQTEVSFCDGPSGPVTTTVGNCSSLKTALCTMQNDGDSSRCWGGYAKTGDHAYTHTRTGQVIITYDQQMPTCDPSDTGQDFGKWPTGLCKNNPSAPGLPMSDARAQAALNAAFDALTSSNSSGGPRISPEQLATLARDMADNGIDMPLDQAVEVSGPSEVVGKPKESVTQKADGTQEKTISQDRATCTYSGSNVNCSVNTTVTNQTITNNNGVTNTTTNSTTTKPADPSPDPCVANPSRVGCVDTGELPGDAPTWRTADVVFAPDALGLPAYCPGPQTWVLPHVSRPLSWSYQPACDVAPMVRAAMLALTALGCVLLIIRTVRT